MALVGIAFLALMLGACLGALGATIAFSRMVDRLACAKCFQQAGGAK